MIKRSTKQILEGLKEVYSKTSYILLTLVIFIFILVLIILFPNFTFIKSMMSSSIFSIWDKIIILWNSLGAIKTNFTFFSRIIAITISFFTGMNVTVLLFYIKKRLKLEKSLGVGFLGTVVGMLGVGCTACGSVILSSIFGFSATASFLGVLPFQGKEIGVVGLVFLLYSTGVLLKKIKNPLICKVK